MEPFNLLDVNLQREISFNLQGDHNTLVYVTGGNILVHVDDREQTVAAGHAVALYGSSGSVTFADSHAARTRARRACGADSFPYCAG